jgi:hypothetical protein
MDKQTDKYNVLPVNAAPGDGEVYTFFGCWLDINQPYKPDGSDNNVLPGSVPPSNQDGPFNDSFYPAITIQEAIMRGGHQCLLAEIAFDPYTIPTGEDPSNCDKLGQRNISFSPVGSAQAVTTFEIRPTRNGLSAKDADELMIDWGTVPKGSTAFIYLPAVSSDTMLSMAARMYPAHKLSRKDANTLQCKTGGITYVPIPPGTDINYAGLLTIELPGKLPREHTYTVVVRQITRVSGTVQAPSSKGSRKKKAEASERAGIGWRRVTGAFQLNIPVKNKETLLIPEERNLSVMRWIGEAIPHQNRWYPVFQRYLQQLGERVIVFGGDPKLVLPSPTGDGIPKHGPGKGHGPGEGHEPGKGHGPEEGTGFTGKISGLLFDRFGDFEGFILDTEEGERKFFSREKDMKELAERVWFERLRITVRTKHDEPHKPLFIILREPPILL